MAHKESFRLGNKYISTSTYSDLFGKCIMFRHSCGVCHFANLKRPSDLTIGDFWGWEKVDKKINLDDKGVSLLLVNTEKGRLLYSKIKDKVFSIKTNVEKCLQPNLQYPSKFHPLRNQIEKDFIHYGFKYIGKKYGNLNFYSQCIELLRKIKNHIFKL